MKFNGFINKACGFKPYEIGNTIGWIKEIPASHGYKTVFKKLPSGTVLKTHVDANNLVWQKQGLLSNGNEMKSYLGSSYGSRTIYIANPNGNGTFALTKNYDYKNNKLHNMITDFKNTHLYSFMTKLKIHMGIE